MIDKLLKRFPRIVNTLVEPTRDHVRAYKELAEFKGFDISGWEWRQQTWEEFMRESDCPEERRFHFISAVHSLYHLKDWKKSLLEMMGCLEDGGMLMVNLYAGNSGAARLVEKFPMLTDDKHSDVTSESVQEFLSDNGFEFQILHQASPVDITCCYEEGHPDKDLLTDFMTHILNFSKTAPQEFVEEVLAYLGGTECSFRKDGKIFFKNDWEATVVSKKGTSK